MADRSLRLNLPSKGALTVANPDDARKNGYIVSGEWAMFEQNFSVLNTPQLSCGEAMRLRSQFVRSFYIRPKKIIKTLCKIKSLRELVFFLALARGYFTSWVKDNI